MTTAAVVGAGPGGLAAASRLEERAGERVEVLLFEKEATAEYLPGTIPAFVGQTPRTRWRRRLDPRGVKVRFGEVEEVSGGGVRIDGGWVEADAVVASPGLVLASERVPDAPNVHTFWDPEGAEGASEAARGFGGGTVTLVVSSLPYRCPSAPYGAAMELAAHYRCEGRDVRVVLTTPEEVPRYLPHGRGSYSRISLRYPDGMPPLAGPKVTLEGPSVRLAADFEASFDRWRSHGEC